MSRQAVILHIDQMTIDALQISSNPDYIEIVIESGREGDEDLISAWSPTHHNGEGCDSKDIDSVAPNR